ncbi:MAG TPA: hypothetical protein VFF65_03865, partial [Phycisphaerales bacterium]|nr:hypothetical protein [Phycisphaerales bacterium]
GDGVPENPWRVNGGTANASTDGVPHPSDGTFAPWANVYRFYLDVSNWGNARVITINASALLNGAVQAAPTSPGGSSYALQLAPGQLETAVFSFTTPTPGAAALLGLGAMAGLRRRR